MRNLCSPQPSQFYLASYHFDLKEGDNFTHNKRFKKMGLRDATCFECCLRR